MGANLGNGSRKHRNARQAAFSEINVTPMVDVMLVLLVIFMVAAPMMTTGVTVDLPEASSNAVTGQDEPISIEIDARGGIKLGAAKTSVALNELTPKLLAITKEKKDTRLFVYGDARVDYGNVIEVFARLQMAGFTKISLITAPEASKPADKGK